MSDEHTDIVDRAVAALLATSGTDCPPTSVVDAVRRSLNAQDASWLTKASPVRSGHSRIAWLQAGACLLLIVAGSWLVASSRQLLSRHAGTHVAPNGTVWRLYSDGQIEVTPGES